MAVNEKFQVAVVPVMVGLYDRLAPELRGRLARFAEQLAQGLSDQHLAVSCGPVASYQAEIRTACKQFAAAGVDLLVVAHLSYAPSGEIVEALLTHDLPVLIWPAQPMRELVAQEYDRATMMMNHGVHGAQDLANVLRRRGRCFGVLHGHWQQPECAAELLTWARAGRALQAMKRSNPIVLGGRFPEMLDLQLDGAAFVSAFGVSGRAVPLEEFAAAARAATQTAVAEKVRHYRTVFEADETVTDELLAQAGRHELALRAVLQRYESRAVGANFLGLCNHEEIRDSLHLAGSVLMAEGIGYGGEGDWTTAMLLRGLLAAGQQASFSEIFSVGYDDNRLVLKHWGEGNPQMAREKPIMRTSKCNDELPAEFMTLDFEFQPGRATLVNINATPDGQGQLITIGGLIEPERLPAMDGPRAVFRPENGDVRALLSDYAYAGGSHHLVMVQQDAQPLLARVARLCGWEHLNK